MGPCKGLWWSKPSLQLALSIKAWVASLDLMGKTDAFVGMPKPELPATDLPA